MYFSELILCSRIRMRFVSFWGTNFLLMTLCNTKISKEYDSTQDVILFLPTSSMKRKCTNSYVYEISTGNSELLTNIDVACAGH